MSVDRFGGQSKRPGAEHAGKRAQQVNSVGSPADTGGMGQSGCLAEGIRDGSSLADVRESCRCLSRVAQGGEEGGREARDSRRANVPDSHGRERKLGPGRRAGPRRPRPRASRAATGVGGRKSDEHMAAPPRACRSLLGGSFAPPPRSRRPQRPPRGITGGIPPKTLTRKLPKSLFGPRVSTVVFHNPLKGFATVRNWPRMRDIKGKSLEYRAFRKPFPSWMSRVRVPSPALESVAAKPRSFLLFRGVAGNSQRSPGSPPLQGCALLCTPWTGVSATFGATSGATLRPPPTRFLLGRSWQVFRSWGVRYRLGIPYPTHGGRGLR